MAFLRRKVEVVEPKATVSRELSAIAIAKAERKQALFAFRRAMIEIQNANVHLDRVIKALRHELGDEEI